MILNYNETAIREQVSLVHFLNLLGHKPASRSGADLWYLSPLQNTRTPTLCVNEALGVWYDHAGAGPSGIKGGDAIDLARAYWYPLSLPAVVEKISLLLSTASDPVYSAPAVHRRPRKAIKLPYYRISDIKELGNNPEITNYLEQKGIWLMARNLLHEVYYYVEDEKKLRKNFFSAGWQNENGGWELSNNYFKGCLGCKGLTIVPGDPGELVIFQNAVDYLRWKCENERQEPTVLLTNGATLLGAAIRRAAKYTGITIYFDGDEAGMVAEELFIKALPQARNGRLAMADMVPVVE